jgi:DNA-binding HxlR family transcriptional regulator
MAERRGYGDPCGIARGLDVVGTRWALLVVRELMLGPKRFGDLRAGLPGMSAETLAQRLRQLEEEGVVQRATLPPPASARVYELTDWGHDLRPVILALGRWGSHAPFPPGDAPLSPDAMMLALPTMFDSARADGLDATYGVRLGEHVFRVRVEGGELDLTRGVADQADAVIATDTATLPELLWRDLTVEGAEQNGTLAIEGSRRAARRFLGLFGGPAG